MDQVEEIPMLQITDFKSLLHATLKVRFAENDIQDTELVEVVELGGYSPADRKPFSFVLQSGLKEKYYVQGTYILMHPEKGDIPVFIVPLGFSDKGMRYEAVFS